MGAGVHHRAALAAVLAGALGCGDDAPATAPRRAAGPLDWTARPAGAADIVVAQVDGRPVYASCVAAQAAGRGLDVRGALDECVGFELLAGAAAARGLAADPEVADAARDAGAVRLIDREFRDRYRTWSDLPSELTGPELEKYAWRMNRPESRASFLVRVEVATPGGADDVAAARAVAAAHAKVGGRADLFGPDVQAAVEEAVRAHAPHLKVVGVRPDPTARDAGLMPYYREAIFALPAIGHVTQPIRSNWGWDLIVWTDVRKPAPMTRADLAAELFEPTRQRFFLAWTDRLMRGHDVAVADAASLRKVWK